MRSIRKNLIKQVMDQHDRLVGDKIKREVFKKHLEQFSDEEIQVELVRLKTL